MRAQLMRAQLMRARHSTQISAKAEIYVSCLVYAGVVDAGAVSAGATLDVNFGSRRNLRLVFWNAGATLDVNFGSRRNLRLVCCP